MRFTILLLALICGVAAAPPTTPTTPKTPPAPISLNIRTAGDLADACSTPPNSAANAAKVNFCNGFAQGVIQTARLNATGLKVCFPSPAPKRNETMKEFVTWTKADANRKDQEASAAFLGFMADRFPCKTESKP
jgi:Rap1a immunity proteins